MKKHIFLPLLALVIVCATMLAGCEGLAAAKKISEKTLLSTLEEREQNTLADSSLQYTGATVKSSNSDNEIGEFQATIQKKQGTIYLTDNTGVSLVALGWSEALAEVFDMIHEAETDSEEGVGEVSVTCKKSGEKLLVHVHLEVQGESVTVDYHFDGRGYLIYMYQELSYEWNGETETEWEKNEITYR